MSLSSWLRRLFGRADDTVAVDEPGVEVRQGATPANDRRRAFPASSDSDLKRKRRSPEGMRQMEAWLAASEAGLLRPPGDVHSSGAWDNYWKHHLEVGALEQGLSDQMASDETLASLLAERGARTILCAGNGLSMEALSLALLGFDVTALDISVVPGEVFQAMLSDEKHPVRQVPGFSSRDDGSVAFEGTGPIDPAPAPSMHQSAAFHARRGGSLAFVTGDLTEPDVCPGPFDVLIERRTLQLFPEAERPLALERLSARLSNRGVFVSQQHDGRCGLDDDRTHYAESWLASRGFVIESATAPAESRDAVRLARLMFSSG